MAEIERLEDSVRRRMRMHENRAVRDFWSGIPAARCVDELPDLLAVKNLTFHYNMSARLKTQPALDNLDLTVKRGEFMAMIGRSGHGKSTLLNFLKGELTSRWRSGTFRINDEEIPLNYFTPTTLFSRLDENLVLMDEDDHRNCGGIGSAARDSCEGKGYTWIVVTHDLVSMFYHADRICYVEQGTIPWIGTPHQMLVDYEAEALPVNLQDYMSRISKNIYRWNPQENFSKPQNCP